MKPMRASGWALVLLLAIANAALGQTGTSRITGVVTDQSGALVAGAKVSVINQGTGASSSTVSTEAGTFTFDALPPSTYTVKVELAGFKTFSSKDNVLTVGTPLTVNAKLEVGEQTTIVEVSASYERVQTSTSGNFGAVVDNRTLTDLPLGLDVGTGGRNPLVFVRLQPGVNFGANTGGASHVNGARDRAFNYTLDGIDINESSAGGSEFSPLRTNPDSLQEFRVITSNATAEYGRNSGAQVELVTKSGTNQFHGNLFFFHRNNGFSANEWEDNRRGIKRPRLIQHQWGGSIGGPIFKDRTFFFFNYQQQRQIRPFTITRTVYTQDARMGRFRYRVGVANGNASSTNPSIDSSGNPLFPACNPPTVVTGCINTYDIAARDPRLAAGLPGGLDPTIGQQWIGITPLPNDFTAGDGLNTAGFTFSGGRLDPQRDFVVKIDHKFNENNTIYGRFAWGKQDTVNDTGNSGQPRFPGLPAIVNTVREPRNLALGYRMVVSPRMVNELVLGGNHFLFDFVTPTAGQVLPFFLTNVTDPLLVSRGNLRKVTTYQLVDNLSYVRGAHTFRGGINFRYQQHIDNRGAVGSVNSELEVVFGNQTTSSGCATGTFATGGTTGVVGGTELFCLPPTSGTLGISASDIGRLRNTINDLLGRISRFQQGFVANDAFDGYQPGGSLLQNDARYGEYDFYFQDSWKFRKNLTIDLGIRWELKGHPTNPRNRIRVPDQAIFAGAPASNTLNWIPGPLWPNDYNNVAPSIGFAWDPFSTGKTSVRGNFRVAFDRINTFVISSQIFNNLPGIALSIQNTQFGVNGGPGGTAGRWCDGLPAIAPAPGTLPSNFTQPAAFGATASITVMDRNFRTPKTNGWQLEVQRELWKGIVVNVAYIGRRATGLFGAYDANQVDYRNNGFLTSFNQLAAFGPCGGSGQPACPAIALFDTLYGPARGTNPNGTTFVATTFQSSLLNGSVAGVANDAATRTVANTASPNCPPAPTVCSLLQAAGMNPFFFKPFPQFSGSITVIDANDFSTYHGLQVIVQRKFTKGMQFQASYTWSKSLDTRSFDPAFTVVSRGAGQSASSSPFDIFDRKLNYARSDFDRAHIFTGYMIYELPFGKGKWLGSDAPGVVQRFIEGWSVTGDFTVQTGRPFTVFSGFSQFSNVVNSTADCTGCPRDMGSIVLRDPAFSNVPAYFNATERARFSQPAAGSIGNTGRNYFTGPGLANVDMAILKRTNFMEGKNLELRIEFFNLTNSPQFGFPTTTIPALTSTGPASSTFGRVQDNVVSFSRKVRIGAKINF